MLCIRQILSGNRVYDEFGVTFDITPSFEEAEAIVVRAVTKDWEVIELLVRCGMYEHKLSSDQLSSHIINAITVRCALQLKKMDVYPSGSCQSEQEYNQYYLHRVYGSQACKELLLYTHYQQCWQEGYWNRCIDILC